MGRWNSSRGLPRIASIHIVLTAITLLAGHAAHGAPGELRTYSASLMQSPGGDAGLVAYSYVAYGLMQ